MHESLIIIPNGERNEIIQEYTYEFLQISIFDLQFRN